MPGFEAMTIHDKDELRRFGALLKRRAEKPGEPVTHAYAEAFGEVVYCAACKDSGGCTECEASR